MRFRSPPTLRRVGMLLLMVLPYARMSHGQTTRIGEGAQKPAVGAHVAEVNLVGSVGREPEVLKLVEEWLDTGKVAHVTYRQGALTLADITRPSTIGSPPVRIWVVAMSPVLLRIYLAEPDAHRYWVRDIPLPNGLDELGRERTAQVILSSAQAFIDHRVSSTRAEVERAFQAQAAGPAPSAPAPPVQSDAATAQPDAAAVRPDAAEGHAAMAIPSESSAGRAGRKGSGVPWRLGVSYGASYAKAISQGPGAVALLELPWRSIRVRPTFLAQFRWQDPIETSGLRISEISVPLSASGVVQWAMQRSFSAQLGMGVGIDFVRISPERLSGSPVEPRAARWDSRPFVTASVGAACRTGDLEIGLVAQGELYTMATAYWVATENGAQQDSRARFAPGVRFELLWARHPPN